jgi:hypothetical protein
LIPTKRHALIIKKATVRWVEHEHFGVELSEADCGTVGELGDTDVPRAQGPISLMMH